MEREQGEVYFITDETAIKIGFSTDPRSRLAALQGSQHAALRLIAAFPGGPQDERALHEHFAHLCIRGEWFQFHQEITDFVASLKGARRALRTRQATIADVIGGNFPGLIVLDRLSAARVTYLKWVSRNPPELGDPKIAAMVERCTCEIDYLVWHRNNPEALFPSIVDGARDKFTELDRLVAEHRAFVGSVCDPVEIIAISQSSALWQRRG